MVYMPYNKSSSNVCDFSLLIRHKKDMARRAASEAKRKEAKLQGLSSVFRKHGVSCAYVFGSVHAGSCRRDSDIDLYVEKVTPAGFWELWRDLETQAGENIDLCCDRDDPVFIRKIKQRGRLIYESGNGPVESRYPGRVEQA